MSDFAKINEVLRQKLSRQGQVPALAKNIHMLIKALSDDDMDYRRLADVIKQYPDIAARLISLANSSWSSPVTPVQTIEQACSRLGLSIVRSISLAVSISAAFDFRKCPSFNTVHYWTSALLVAEGAGKIALEASIDEQSEFVQTAQTAGLLHNLGLLWLADNLPDETSQALAEVKQQPELCVSEALKEMIGVDYCLIGGWLAKKLEFPDVLRLAMVEHLNDDYQGVNKEIVWIVNAAVKMAAALQHQHESCDFIDLEPLGIDASMQGHIFQHLSAKFEDTKKLAQALFTG